MSLLDLSRQRKEGAREMYRDPYMDLQMHEQEIRRAITQNAQEREAREAREAKAQLVAASAGRPRVKARAGAALVAPLAAITRVLGPGRTAI
jgi:ribosome-binding ATPase YchF (GTP1/OBG family)